MIYDLLKVFLFPYCSFGNGRFDHFTDLMIYLDITQIGKYVIKLAKNLNFCAKWLVVKHRKGWGKLLCFLNTHAHLYSDTNML